MRLPTRQGLAKPGLWIVNAILLCTAVTAGAAVARRGIPAEVASVWADVRATNLAGETISLGQTSSARVYLLFTPLCSVCDEVAPDWRSIAAALDASRVPLTYLVWHDDDPALVRSFMERYSLSGDVLMVNADDMQNVLQINMTPAAMVTNASGALTYVEQGRMAATELLSDHLRETLFVHLAVDREAR